MIRFVLIAAGVWAVAMVIWWVSAKAFRRADAGRLTERLAGSRKEGPKQKSKIRTPALFHVENAKGYLIGSLLQRLRWEVRVRDLLEQAGLTWSPVRFLHASLALFLAAYGVCWLMLPADYRLAALAPAAVAGVLPLAFVRRKRRKRLHRFEELFPESLEFVSRSMRAGHAFSVSLDMIHREFDEPLAGEFRRAFEEHNLGVPLNEALEKLARRVPSLDVHFFVSAVLLQQRTGGNLAEILDKLAYVIRERFKLRGKIRAISAHGRMTGIALTLIPVGVAVFMFIVNPDYIHFFFEDQTGHYMLAAAVGLQVIGYAVIKKIVKIEV